MGTLQILIECGCAACDERCATNSVQQDQPIYRFGTHDAANSGCQENQKSDFGFRQGDEITYA
jgi:hypothetical protein